MKARALRALKLSLLCKPTIHIRDRIVYQARRRGRWIVRSGHALEIDLNREKIRIAWLDKSTSWVKLCEVSRAKVKLKGKQKKSREFTKAPECVCHNSRENR